MSNLRKCVGVATSYTISIYYSVIADCMKRNRERHNLADYATIKNYYQLQMVLPKDNL